MTPKERAAMQQALEVLEQHIEHFDYEQFTSICELDPAKDAILSLREALADSGKPIAEQKPVAWALSHSLGVEFGSKYPMQETKEAAEQMARQHMGAVVVTPLYAAPVRTKDLTDDEIHKCMNGNFYNALDFARAVIAADREKNK